jgi:hypothetical protein
MSDSEYILRQVKLLRRKAKFLAYSHSRDFIDPLAGLGTGFHYVNLYDEKIDSNLINSPRGPILLHNTYLSSFAYNLCLCVLWEAKRAANPLAGNEPTLEQRLRHNFKKFFAEQLLHLHNNIFARAVFFETLLFEQTCMVPVFEAVAHDEDLQRKAEATANLMSMVVSLHELSHFLLAKDAREGEQLLASPAAIGALCQRVSRDYPAPFAEEFRCDAMAAVSCLQQFEPVLGRLFCLRALVFAFSAFAVLSSLTKSATKTAADQQKHPEYVDFTSIRKQHRDYDYSVGPDLDLVERARLIIELCTLLAQADETDLFGSTGDFPLAATIVDDLLVYVDTVLVSEDKNAREMSLLVAEALHEHPRGTEYAYLRSKTFQFGSQRGPDGELLPA